MKPPTTTQTGFIEELYRAHEQQLRVYLTGILGNPEIAREVAHDSFEALYTAYEPGKLYFPRAALFRVATNFALMQLRRRRVERRVFGKLVDAEYMEEVPDESLPPDRQVLTYQVADQLETTVKALRPTLRRVFLLAHVHGKSRREIAATLGVSEKRVDKRMTKALRECRKRLISSGIELG